MIDIMIEVPFAQMQAQNEEKLLGEGSFQALFDKVCASQEAPALKAQEVRMILETLKLPEHVTDPSLSWILTLAGIYETFANPWAGLHLCDFAQDVRQIMIGLEVWTASVSPSSVFLQEISINEEGQSLIERRGFHNNPAHRAQITLRFLSQFY